MTGFEPYLDREGGAGARAESRVSGMAIASLALGVIGLVAVPLIASVLAVAFGGSARREIERDPRLGGDGLARAGIILGWVGIALVALGLLFFLFFVAILF